LAKRAKEKVWEEENEGVKIFKKIFFSLFLLSIVFNFTPDAIPFGFWEFWSIKGTWSDWIHTSWPVLAWGSGVTFLVAICGANPFSYNENAEAFFVEGFWKSMIAGVGEEIVFRWLIFLSSIVTVQIANFFFFDFFWFGLAEWTHLNLFAPLANWATLGSLQDKLYHPWGWAVGAGLLTSNSLFRDGHKYLGWFGYVNSWFIGMFLFWAMFKFGLPVAILIHFVYDLLIFAVRYIDAVFERKLGLGTYEHS
jgi:hypothetical protein